ncbi:MAG: PIG-L family deacetylase [Opitutaceae bacterium]
MPNRPFNIRRLAVLATVGMICIPAVKHRCRRLAGGLARLVLRLRSRPYVPEGNPIALIIAPHPDDEVMGCGGLIARKRLEGHPVHVVFVTDGGASHPGHPTLSRADVVLLRATEARTALRELGVETPSIHFLEAADGTLAWQAPEQASSLARRLGELISRVRPDEIFTPCRHDGSSEHDACFILLEHALRESTDTSRIFEYPIWCWWNPIRLIRPALVSRRVLRLGFKNHGFIKQRALAAYRSQFEPTPPWKNPLIPPDFASLFTTPEEFYFET